MRVPLRAFVASLAVLLAMAGLVAQQKAVSPVEKRARSLVSQLELADRRAAAAEELQALGAAAVPALAARIADPRPEVVQVVCEVLCSLGTTAAGALPQLVTAIGSPNPAIVRMVRMTDLAVRATGVTTLCEYEKQQVVQIDADGTEHELVKGKMAWDVDPLPDGHVLLTLYQESRVVEFDDMGKEVWSFAGKTPLEADRLLDGHTLIADAGARRIVEVDEKGNEVWEFAIPDKGCMPYDVERLANGHTLIAVHPGQVLEVDRAGVVVWELRDLEGVFDADRLPNGNTLLALYTAGAVREVNRKGEVVWEVKVKQPNDADRLPNGNTLVGTADSLLELSPDGKTVREDKRGKRVSEVHRR